jgi:prepilin-type N-terminal cleavage/methylation domain-containing protein
MFKTPMLNKRIHSIRNARTKSRSQLGMTLLEIMIVLAIIAVVMGLLIGPKVMAAFSSSKAKTTKLDITQIAGEAYGLWSSETGEACPNSLADLEKYRNSKSTKDGWGSELIMLCGENAPEGAPLGFAVLSKGEDKKQGTKDDVKSWE